MDAHSSTRHACTRYLIALAMKLPIGLAMKLPIALAICASIGACAVSSSQVQPVQAGSGRYAVMDCAQLASEELRLRDEIAALSVQIDAGNTSDRVAMGLGVVFWPALFLINGKGEIVDSLAQTKGELQAVREAHELNGCNIRQRQVDKKPSEKIAGQFVR